MKLFNSKNGVRCSITDGKTLSLPIITDDYEILATQYTHVKTHEPIQWIDVFHRDNNVKSFALTRPVVLNESFEPNQREVLFRVMWTEYLCDFIRYNIPIYTKFESNEWVTYIGSIKIRNNDRFQGYVGNLQLYTRNEYVYIDKIKIDKTYYLNFNPMRISTTKFVQEPPAVPPPQPPCLMSNADFPALKRK